MKNPKAETPNDVRTPNVPETLDYIQQKTIVAQVMDKLRDLIASGVYKPGDRIPTEHELAQRFGIGRSSIREAIKTFQYLGILESRVAKGTFLCNRSHISTEAILWSLLLGDDDMWEILALRQSIENTAFRTVMQKYIKNKKEMEPMIQSLRAEVKNMKAAVRENSNEKMVQADFNFHAILIREGGVKLFRDGDRRVPADIGAGRGDHALGSPA
jgi:DNA-binding FadR family transcriptional regulator